MLLLRINYTTHVRIIHAAKLIIITHGRNLPTGGAPKITLLRQWIHIRKLVITFLVCNEIALEVIIEHILFQIILRFCVADNTAYSVVVFINFHCMLYTILHIQRFSRSAYHGLTSKNVLDLWNRRVLSLKYFIELFGDNEVFPIQLLLVNRAIKPIHIFLIIIQTILKFDLTCVDVNLVFLLEFQFDVHFLQAISVYF